MAPIRESVAHNDLIAVASRNNDYLNPDRINKMNRTGEEAKE